MPKELLRYECPVCHKTYEFKPEAESCLEVCLNTAKVKQVTMHRCIHCLSIFHSIGGAEICESKHQAEEPEEVFEDEIQSDNDSELLLGLDSDDSEELIQIPEDDEQ